MAIKYLNPYTEIGTKYSQGLDSIVVVLEPLYPNQTIENLVDAVYTYVSTAYSLTPDTLEEQNTKQLIYTLINGYLNYQLLYTPQQMDFIHKLIGGTLGCGNPEDILQHILDTEEEITSSGLTSVEQMPLLIATAVGKSAFTYWATKVTTPGLWANFINSFTPAIVKFPYWVSASMQGSLIGINTINIPDGEFANALKVFVAVQGFEIFLSLYGSLAVSTGKVVFNLQQRSLFHSDKV